MNMANAYWGLVEDQFVLMSDKDFQDAAIRFLKLWNADYERRFKMKPTETVLQPIIGRSFQKNFRFCNQITNEDVVRARGLGIQLSPSKTRRRTLNE